jgi:Flp pilus assembly pilin Flp
MRAFEYGLMVLFFGGLLIWGATALGNAISASVANSAATIDRASAR